MRPRLLTILLAAALLTACGTSVKRSLYDQNIETREVTVTAPDMTVYLDDHTRTKKNADAVFNSWVQSRGMQRHVTGKRLLSINPKADGCRLVYDFRMIDVTEQRVTLIVPEYRQAYWKDEKKAARRERPAPPEWPPQRPERTRQKERRNER